jgi:hypothetical protein
VGNRGWLAVVETTWSASAWHVHFHVFLDAEFWPQHELADAWTKAAGGSALVVDIRRADRGIAREIAKYTLKPAGVPRNHVAEYAWQSKGARLLSVGGAWLGMLPTDDSAQLDEVESEWVFVAFEALERLQADGDEWAASVLRSVEAWIAARASPWCSPRASRTRRVA